MRNYSWIALGIAFLSLLFSSCSSMQTPASAVRPAGYENEKPGWIKRNLSSLETLSSMIPPPTEARTKWDETLKKHRDGNNSEAGF
ncbi:MAG: hypothetical protein ACP5VS_19175 [Desulfomonilaceae bacterium]